VQQNHHSTVVSYLHRLIILLTGSFGRPGTHYIPNAMVDFVNGEARRTSPVVGARLVGGLVPCNVIADEILTDHPARYRAMLVEAANPAHSLADGPRMREALAALDTLVVIDVAMTETARLAHYVLPAATQFEKAEATFFNFEFPHNTFHLRRRLLPPPATPCPRPRSTRAWCEALGAVREDDLAPLRAAAAAGRAAYLQAFATRVMSDPRLSAQAPVVLYRTLDLPDDAREGAVLLGPGAARGDDRRAVAGARRVRRAAPGRGQRAVRRDRRVAVGRGVRGRRLGRAARARTAPGRQLHLALPDLLEASGDPGPRRRAIPTSRSCCRPASAARSPPTRSSAIRRGARRTRGARCASTPTTPRTSASPTRVRAVTTAGLGRRGLSRSPTPCSAATSRCPTASASTTPTAARPSASPPTS
jgi:hypothetical protein